MVRAPLPRGRRTGVRPIRGGALVQDRDRVVETRDGMQVASTREPSEHEWADLVFAWTVAARVKSNAIVLREGRGHRGGGRRADVAGRLGVDRRAKGAGGGRAAAVMASDAFFPFPDALEVAVDAGITAVIHPGGSMRDEEVLAVAERHGLAVVTSGRAHGSGVVDRPPGRAFAGRGIRRWLKQPQNARPSPE